MGIFKRDKWGITGPCVSNLPFDVPVKHNSFKYCLAMHWALNFYNSRQNQASGLCKVKTGPKSSHFLSALWTSHIQRKASRTYIYYILP